MDHPLELQLSSSNSSSSCSTQDSPSPSWTFTQQKGTLTAVLEQLPIPFMINVLDEMCHLPELAQHQRQVLSNPYNVSNILRCEPSARTKLTVYFQWLEKSTKNFVWTLTENICHFIALYPDLSDGHLLGFRYMLKLGTFLMEAGWYAEAIILLNIAKGQAKGRSIKTLQVLKVLVLAESLSNRDEAAFLTISEIHSLAGITKVVPMSLTAELHCALAASYFENCEFNASYQQGLLALQLLGEGICPYETMIGTFRQLGRSCIAKQRLFQAKLLITQAVSWAWHSFGSTSVVYAEALEDYAFYLLMMNAYDDAMKVVTEAKNIYFDVYGYLGVQAELAQGNLAFRLYLESYGYQELGSLDQYMEYIVDLEDNRRKAHLGGSDDRQMLAVGRMRPLVAVGDICKVGNVMVPRDGVENVQPQMVVNDVRRLFFTNLL
ncbi:uncharacterized protein LOC135713280 [Ochlerotatus camptorhynchus]|uniref:uncharacterized protein LOC135713280 n=1 Tax=Ochlerotatus camptorhynchus TaxID=644619 RepID=UPI0031D2EF50